MSKPGSAAVAQVVKLLLPAGKASPSPPLGPAAGSRGVKAMEIAKQFNAMTGHYSPGVPIPTLLTIQPDKTFSLSTRTPPVAHLLRTAAGIEKGSAATPSTRTRLTRAATSGSTAGGSDFSGKVSVKHIYEIAKIKMMDEDLKVLGLERVARSVLGSARSLGLEVVA